MSQYPLREHAAETLRAHSGRRLDEISAEAVDAGEISGADLRIHADALRQQANIARNSGFPQLAANLLRAAELSDVPNEELLRIYETLRPERASHAELLRLADYLEDAYGAHENAKFIREAAAVYRERNLLRRD
ncbi:MAG: diol dehydratase small subunit [Chloroflexi bacterium]|nr:diol dehydratase small subunit [Chloroflexota bacterium]MCY3582964.1 diol dehydratase small subunit [Chloroflexota bacterium]MCY3716868.1 diol dehydratase small subunit [Chloroflexota bacterium]MDE2649259.1 diol dehydratase small subunit [Chloroflexota bacterium]